MTVNNSKIEEAGLLLLEDHAHGGPAAKVQALLSIWAEALLEQHLQALAVPAVQRGIDGAHFALALVTDPVSDWNQQLQDPADVQNHCFLISLQ